MLNYIFKEVFRKLNGSDIHINQNVIMYRKNGVLLQYKLVNEKEYTKILNNAKYQLNLQSNVTSQEGTLEKRMNGKQRKIRYVVQSTYREGLCFTFRLVND